MTGANDRMARRLRSDAERLEREYLAAERAGNPLLASQLAEQAYWARRTAELLASGPSSQAVAVWLSGRDAA